MRRKGSFERHKFMLKPHLWLGWGQFTSDLNFEKESDWKIFEESFKEYILTFARLAESEKVEVFWLPTPYISGSNYILKMSDYKKDAWVEVWDALFWRFMDKQRGFF